MLVNMIIDHCIKFRWVKENKVASGGKKYIERIKHNKNIKLKLKNLFLNILVLKMLFAVLQFIAWIICIKQIVKKDMVLAISGLNMWVADTNITRTTNVWMNPW